MTWTVSYREASVQAQWCRVGHPSREDALTFAETILRSGGVVLSIVERLSDGSRGEQLDQAAILRDLDAD
jgi:hypothetical protein